MNELMRYKGKRSLIAGMNLEPGQVYWITLLNRKLGRDGFWVEVSDDRNKCRRPYESKEAFLENWGMVKPKGML